MRPSTTLDATRLRLRPPRREDAEAVFLEYARDPEVTRFMPWRPHARIEETLAFLERADGGWSTGSEYTWALVLPPSDRVVGMFALRPDGVRAEIGYVLSRRHWGRGLIAEAGRAVIAEAFREPSLHRVWAVCDVDNLRSARVLEKLGMEREGVLRRWVVHPAISPVPRDCAMYARVRELGEAPRAVPLPPDGGIC